MGLGANNKRIKLSHDPNNTAWSTSTSKYGHRILSTQGWKDGDFLGADNAAHSEHFSAANASHIRVLLREDNPGLGARVGGTAKAETFGLSTLSGIFGRLNGKSAEDVRTQQGRLRDAELRGYQVQKHGSMNFVSGGLLVGNEMVSVQDDLAPGVAVEVAGEVFKAPKKCRNVDRAALPGESKRKKQKPGQKDGVGAAEDLVEEHAQNMDERTKNREGKRDGKPDGTSKIKVLLAVPSADDASQAQQAKRARKEERRRSKDAKRQTAAAELGHAAERVPIVESEAHDEADVSTMGNTTPVTGTSTPSIAFLGGRHAVRQRYIQQKRLASMDPQALKEILMLKASA